MFLQMFGSLCEFCMFTVIVVCSEKCTSPVPKMSVEVCWSDFFLHDYVFCHVVTWQLAHTFKCISVCLYSYVVSFCFIKYSHDYWHEHADLVIINSINILELLCNFWLSFHYCVFVIFVMRKPTKWNFVVGISCDVLYVL